MKKLSGLKIEVEPHVHQLGYGIVRYVVTAEYSKDSSSVTEQYYMGTDPDNLDRLFDAIKEKVRVLDRDENFGDARQV